MENQPTHPKRGLRTVFAKHLSAAVCGAFFALCSMGDLLAPTGVAFMAAAPPTLLPASALGTLAALLLRGDTQALRYAAACCVLAAVRLLFGRSFGFSDYPWYEPLLAATVTLSTGFAMELTGGRRALFLLEAPFAAALTLLFSAARRALSSGKRNRNLPRREAGALLLSLALLGYSATSLLFGQTVQGAALCLFFAALVFASGRMRRESPIFSPVSADPSDSPNLQNRTKRTAASLRELSSRLNAAREATSPAAALTPTVEELCRRCEHAPKCWNSDAMSMEDALGAMAVTLRRDGRLRDDLLPAPFVERCKHRDSFVDMVNHEAMELSQTRRFRESLQGAPDLLGEQVKCFSVVLEDLGDEEELTRDPSLEELLLSDRTASEELLLHAGVGKNGRLRIRGESDTRPPVARFAAAARDARCVSLAEPSLWRDQNRWHFVINEAPSLRVSVERHLSPACGERQTGDSLREFYTEDMQFVAALSDGMGSGAAASSKSRMAVDTLEKLMQAGLRREAATRLLNTALLAGNQSEVFATLDAVILDLYSGDAEFVKAGAAPSFILRSGRLTRVAARGMPVGILPQWEASVTRSRLEAGDAVILMSDGLLMPGEPEQPLLDFILSFDRRRGSLARAMVEFCRNAYRHLPPDDMTVVILDLQKNEP